MAGEETPNPGQAFASLMSKAAESASPAGAEPWLNADGSHRYGSHPDGSPKKAAGRPRKPPSVEELKAAKAQDNGAPAGSTQPGDQAPVPGKRKRGSGQPDKPGDVPQHRPGVITKGMNKRYRQLGKLIRPFDKDIGQALIDMTANNADPPEDGQELEDTSVGACWDDVARSNPRVRKFCLAMIQGGAYGALVMAHAPLGVAIALKFVSANPGFIGKLILSMAEPEPDAPEGEGGLPFGLTADDAKQMMAMAGPLLGQMGLSPDVAAQAADVAANGERRAPPATRRQQPGTQQFARHGQGRKR